MNKTDKVKHIAAVINHYYYFDYSDEHGFKSSFYPSLPV